MLLLWMVLTNTIHKNACLLLLLYVLCAYLPGEDAGAGEELLVLELLAVVSLEAEALALTGLLSVVALSVFGVSPLGAGRALLLL